MAGFYSGMVTDIQLICDAGSIHVTAIGIATRYIHSHAGILHRDDYDNAVKLMVEVIKKLDRNAVKKITFD
ncbi:hypothetical protein [Lysinibacillus sp. CD3-6]|uniref:hypothetical protein n=1 Tax=Lysinibacillus sp. CD3-6 TaxID=2892541 RepID=UPI002102B144|nr:hypothetical protein [Lysinibacillus sp. CD3-6]